MKNERGREEERKRGREEERKRGREEERKRGREEARKLFCQLCRAGNQTRALYISSLIYSRFTSELQWLPGKKESLLLGHKTLSNPLTREALLKGEGSVQLTSLDLLVWKSLFLYNKYW